MSICQNNLANLPLAALTSRNKAANEKKRNTYKSKLLRRGEIAEDWVCRNSIRLIGVVSISTFSEIGTTGSFG